MREQIVSHFRPHAPGLEAFFGSLESTLLDHIWSVGQASARDCLTMLHASGQFISYGAVKTVLDRLTAKQILQRDRADQNYLYTACCSRDVFEHQAIAEIIGRLLHDYGDSVYASLDKLDARVVVV